MEDPVLVAVIRVCALELLLGPFIDISSFALMREMDFRAQAVRKALPSIVASGASVVFALYGAGYGSRFNNGSVRSNSHL